MNNEKLVNLVNRLEALKRCKHEVFDESAVGELIDFLQPIVNDEFAQGHELYSDIYPDTPVIRGSDIWEMYLYVETSNNPVPLLFFEFIFPSIEYSTGYPIRFSLTRQEFIKAAKLYLRIFEDPDKEEPDNKETIMELKVNNLTTETNKIVNQKTTYYFHKDGGFDLFEKEEDQNATYRITFNNSNGDLKEYEFDNERSFLDALEVFKHIQSGGFKQDYIELQNDLKQMPKTKSYSPDDIEKGLLDFRQLDLLKDIPAMIMERINRIVIGNDFWGEGLNIKTSYNDLFIDLIGFALDHGLINSLDLEEERGWV